MSITGLTASASILIAGASPQETAQDHDGWIQQASGACEAGDFWALFDAFARSSQVRRLYSAPRIEQRTRGTPSLPLATQPEGPDDFAIGMVDYTYADAGSIRRWEAGETETFVRLKIEPRRLKDGAMRVDYQPGEFLDDEEGDGATFIRATGEPAAYVFSPFGRCWRLTQHLR